MQSPLGLCSDFHIIVLASLIWALDYIVTVLDFVIRVLDFLITVLDFLITVLDFLITVLAFLITRRRPGSCQAGPSCSCRREQGIRQRHRAASP